MRFVKLDYVIELSVRSLVYLRVFDGEFLLSPPHSDHFPGQYQSFLVKFPLRIYVGRRKTLLAIFLQRDYPIYIFAFIMLVCYPNQFLEL